MRIITKVVISSAFLMLSGQLLFAQGGETAEEAKERLINNLMVGANKAFTDGNIAVAKDSLKNLIGMDSQFAPAYFLSGKINVREKNYVEAGRNIRRSIELDPENEKYRKELKNIIGLNYNDGNLEYKKGNYSKAMEKYDTVLKFDSRYSSAYYMKGIIAKRQRNNKESIKQFTMAIKSDPTMSKAYYARGNSYLSDRNYDMAIEDFETATSLNPMDAKEFSGCIGLPISSTEICIRDDEGNELGFNEPGELCIRGPQVMRGYWQRPEATAEAISDDGWFATGDIGIVDEGGFVKLVLKSQANLA